MRNASWLNPLLFSYCPCIHFSSWDTSSCGRVILQKKLSSHFASFILPWLLFLLRNSVRGKMAQHFKSLDCLGTHLFFGISLWFSNSLLGGGMVCQMPFQWGTQSGSHSSLACSRKHSLITHRHLLMFYKNQPKKPSCKNESKNREATTDWSGRVSWWTLAGTAHFVMALTLGREKHRRRCNSSNRDKPLSWDFFDCETVAFYCYLQTSAG